MYLIERCDNNTSVSSFSKCLRLEDVGTEPIVDVYVSLNKYRQALFTIKKLQDSLSKIKKECSMADMYKPTEQIEYINRYY